MGYRQGDERAVTDKVYSHPIWWTTLLPGVHREASQLFFECLPRVCMKTDQWFKARQVLGIQARPLIEVLPSSRVYRKALMKLEGEDPGSSAENAWQREHGYFWDK